MDSSASSEHSDVVCSALRTFMELRGEVRAKAHRDIQFYTMMEMQRAELRERGLTQSCTSR